MAARIASFESKMFLKRFTIEFSIEKAKPIVIVERLVLISLIFLRTASKAGKSVPQKNFFHLGEC